MGLNKSKQLDCIFCFISYWNLSVCHLALCVYLFCHWAFTLLFYSGCINGLIKSKQLDCIFCLSVIGFLSVCHLALCVYLFCHWVFAHLIYSGRRW